MKINEKFDVQEIPEDFKENVNESILLTGAGFSNSFGGILADDLWQYIFNHDRLTKPMKDLVIEKSSNYEDIYSNLSDKDRKEFIEILLEIFCLMDKRISSSPYFTRLKPFIDLFVSQDKYNFIFTTNQDLLIERYYISQCKNIQQDNDPEKQIADIVSLNFPYVQYSLTDVARDTSNKCTVNMQEYVFEKFVRLIALYRSNVPVKNDMNYVKLHGSYNWKHSDGYLINITGNNKTVGIDKSKILRCSSWLFDNVIESKNKKIVVVGYGFNDAHINDKFFAAVEAGSSIIIISPIPISSFTSRILLFSENNDIIPSKEKSMFIFNAITKYICCNFSKIIDPEGDGFNKWLFQNLKEYIKK